MFIVPSTKLGKQLAKVEWLRRRIVQTECASDKFTQGKGAAQLMNLPQYRHSAIKRSFPKFKFIRLCSSSVDFAVLNNASFDGFDL